MTTRRRPEPKDLLTDMELELMSILWRLGEGGVQDVLGALPLERPLARTTVSTVLRILEGKGVLEARAEGRAHIYVPRLRKEEYEARSLQHLVRHVFDGDARGLLVRLVDTKGIDARELDAVRALLKKKGRRL